MTFAGCQLPGQGVSLFGKRRLLECRSCRQPGSGKFMASASAEKGTISIRLVREALHELRQRGCDEASLLQGAGIDGELLAEPDGRVSSEAYGQLWLGIAQQMDDEFFGMNPRRMKSGSFAFMARAAVKEPTLGAALQAVLRLLQLIFDGFSPRLEVRDGLAAIVIDEPPAYAVPEPSAAVFHAANE